MDINNNTFDQNNISCEAWPLLTKILIAIYVINIFMVSYIINNEYDKNLNISISTIIKLCGYIFALILVIQYECDPIMSLLYHPPIVAALIIYIISITSVGALDLYALSQTDESFTIFNKFKTIVSKFNNYIHRFNTTTVKYTYDNDFGNGYDIDNDFGNGYDIDNDSGNGYDIDNNDAINNNNVEFFAQ